MKVLFFGTPAISVPYLDWLIKNTTVVGVVCRPDEPAGRGHKITSPPVKIRALESGIPVFQPAGPWTPEVIEPLQNFGAELGVAVAYGRILPEAIFGAPKLGTINIHFSLLPKYRGAAPMQWALINGEFETGVTAFWLEAGLDSGPIFHQSKLSIEADDNLPTLRNKLIPLGIDVLSRVVADAVTGNIVRSTQVGEPTLAPLLKKEMGRVDWSKPASTIANLVRGLCEWPGVMTTYHLPDATTRQLKLVKARALEHTGGFPSGTIVDVRKNEGLVVSCGRGELLVSELQPEGKKSMPSEAFWLGARLDIGARLV